MKTGALLNFAAVYSQSCKFIHLVKVWFHRGLIVGHRHFLNVEFFYLFLTQTHGSQNTEQQQYPHLEIRNTDLGVPASDLDLLNKNFWMGPSNLLTMSHSNDSDAC